MKKGELCSRSHAPSFVLHSEIYSNATEVKMKYAEQLTWSNTMFKLGSLPKAVSSHLLCMAVIPATSRGSLKGEHGVC